METTQTAGFLTGLDDAFLFCRNDHEFDKIKPGRVLSNTNIEPVGFGELVGHYEIVQTCPICGTVRRKITGESWRYKYPRGYQSPKGANLYYNDFAAEKERRLIEGGIFK